MIAVTSRYYVTDVEVLNSMALMGARGTYVTISGYCTEVFYDFVLDTSAVVSDLSIMGGDPVGVPGRGPQLSLVWGSTCT